jgi:hypothetical protein
MRDWLDRLVNPLHLLIALAGAWLVLSSPWVGLYVGLPDEPGLINLSHVVLGAAMLPLGLLYVAACSTGGRWRQYFPWLAGQFGDLGRDLVGLARGERPGPEGGGLFATIEGLLLLALLAAAATGVMWYLSADLAAAVWRSYHLIAAHGFAGLAALHVVAVSLHLLDFVRG